MFFFRAFHLFLQRARVACLMKLQQKHHLLIISPRSIHFNISLIRSWNILARTIIAAFFQMLPTFGNYI